MVLEIVSKTLKSFKLNDYGTEWLLCGVNGNRHDLQMETEKNSGTFGIFKGTILVISEYYDASVNEKMSPMGFSSYLFEKAKKILKN